MGLCKDGLPFVGIALLLTLCVGAWFGFWFAFPLAGLSLFIAWFFRDPERTLPEDPRALVSPADGKIIDIRRVPYPRLLSGEATRVSIFMSVVNVHVNRIPFGGKIRQVHYNPGKFLAAFSEKSSLENEQTAIVIDTDRGFPLMLVQIAGLIARRIVCRVSPGESVECGEKYGLIRFGSRADLYLPENVEVTVRVGETVKGGSSVLGFCK